MKNKENHIIDEYTFTQLKIMSNVVECAIERNNDTEIIYFHNSIDKKDIDEIILFIRDPKSFHTRLEVLKNRELFDLLNCCFYLGIKDMIDLLTNKIVCNIKYMNKKELEKYFE